MDSALTEPFVCFCLRSVMPFCVSALFEQEADALFHFRQRLVRDVGRALGAFAHLLLEVGAVVHDALEVLAYGAQLLGHGLADGQFEVAVAFACELRRDCVHTLARDGAVDRHEVVDAILAFAVADLGLAVRDGALEFLDDDIFVVEDGDRGFRVRVGLAHLARRILQAHDARARFRIVALRQLERLAVRVVEPRRDVARELEVLRLVGADGDVVGLVEQDVARHERRIGKETRVDVLRVLRGFVLELRHAGELTELRAAIHDPAHLRVAFVVALHEHEAFLRVDAAGQQQRKGLPRLLAAFLRVDVDRQGVQIGDEIVAVVLLLDHAPVAHGTEVVAEREYARRLDAGEDDLLFVLFLCGCIFRHSHFSFDKMNTSLIIARFAPGCRENWETQKFCKKISKSLDKFDGMRYSNNCETVS